jgi:hypothetical protein
MDSNDIEEAKAVLVKVLAAIEAGELVATRRVADRIRGAIAALEALATTARGA